MADEKTQLEFIHYITRIFKEGDFTATYKYGFLHAIANISILKPQQYQLEISISEIAEQMVSLYWGQAKPYLGTSNSLIQTTKNQMALVNKIAKAQQSDLNLNSFRLKHSEYKKLINSVKGPICDGPLRRLQKLARSEENFLYEEIVKNKMILLNPDIQFCFRTFYDLIITLTKQQWMSKVRSIPANSKIVDPKGELQKFMFGESRNNLSKVRNLLVELQENRCFYCEKQIGQNKDVDHFIPWSLYPNDLGHNFVLAHSSCNHDKKAMLAADYYRSKWHALNIVKYGDIITQELNEYFLCNIDQSTAITDWAYDNQNIIKWTPKGFRYTNIYQYPIDSKLVLQQVAEDNNGYN